ncbi:MAG TPA: autotransporter domain-containing protein [Azospirillaceae bacterium]|nr:autotransporter domain-containing protein [Azospirillaceae bacterium]
MGTTALAAVFALAAGGAQAQQAPQRFNSLTVFGDSLSDTGNLAAFGAAPPAPYFNGRFSNGPVWNEQVGALLGGIPMTSRALGGANAGSAEVIDIQNQITRHLAATPSLDSRGLYAVWIGANDYFDFFGAPTADATGYARNVALNAANAASRLVQAGARNVLLFNLPNLGDTVAGRAGGAAASAQANQLTAVHNTFLAGFARDVSAATGANVILVDINSSLQAVFANPATYGFNNLTIPCFTGTALTGVCATQQGAQGTLFFDAVHPTTTAHALTAQFVSGTLSAVFEAPETVAARTQLGLAMHKAVTDAASARLAGARAGTGTLGMGAGQAAAAGSDGRVGVFLYGNYVEGDRDAFTGQSGFDYDAYTVAAGADYMVDDNVMAGLMLGYGDGSQDLDLGAGDTDVKSYSLTGYFTAAMDALYLDGSFSYSFEDYEKIRRATRFAPVSTAEASTHGNTYGAALTAGWNFVSGPVSVGPLASLRYINTEIDGYTEDNAAALGLTVDQTDAESLVSSVGAQLSARLGSEGVVFAPYLKAAWEKEHLNDARRVFVTLSSGQRGFAEPGAGETNWYVGGAGVSVESGTLSASVGWEGTLNSDDRGQDHAFMGRVRFGF